MDATLLEQLLYEDESSTLDFKRDQYRFNGATDDEKSELLKDILGFANAWRRSEAYILIGVDEVRGGRSIVIGTNDHLEDHSLQQFVNSKTNKPIVFGYQVRNIDGSQIGVIRIEQHPRPFYLTKDYGTLKREKVYVRRGSSTDPTKPATPEEIAQMGVANNVVPPESELTVEFAHAEIDEVIGTELPLSAEWCDMPSHNAIPSLIERSVRNPLGINLSAMRMFDDKVLNKNYYREVANYEFARRLFRPIRLVVTNKGKLAANDVRFELDLRKGEGVCLCYPSEIPEQPQRQSSRFDVASQSLRSFRRRAVFQSAGDVTIESNDERINFILECGNIQPGRKIYSDGFCIGVADSGEKQLIGMLYAESLSEPKELTLCIDADITKTSMSPDELMHLAHEKCRDQDDDEQGDN